MPEDDMTDSLMDLLRGWKHSVDPAKREGYALMEAGRLAEEQRLVRTWTLTRTFAPPPWQTLLDAGELPADFDGWADSSFRTLLHQGGISAGVDLRVPGLTSTRRLIAALPPDAQASKSRFDKITRRAYYLALSRIWGAETDARLTALAAKHHLPVTELIDKG
jgi:hypothetical protein